MDNHSESRLVVQYGETQLTYLIGCQTETEK